MFVNCEIVRTATPFKWEFCDQMAYDIAKERAMNTIQGMEYSDLDLTLSKETATAAEYNWLYNMCDHYECMHWND